MTDAPPDPAEATTQLRVENSLLRASLWLTARRLKDYQDGPATKLDQLREALKLTNYWGTERAARTMVPMLFGTSAPADMLARLKVAESLQQAGTLLPQFGAGGTAGLLGMPQVRDKLGLLGP